MNIEKKSVVIINFQLGNLFSVQQACMHFGLMPQITDDKEKIRNAQAIILPGVGAFGDAMQNLQRLDLVSPLKDFIASGKPVFGICLGMQLLFEESEEFGNYKGLGIIPGIVQRFPDKYLGDELKVPNIGWNTIYHNGGRWVDTPLENIKQNQYMYFVHSYYVRPLEEACILSFTSYKCFEYCSSIKYKNIFATQFHPEKSSYIGLNIYRDWINSNLLK